MLGSAYRNSESFVQLRDENGRLKRLVADLSGSDRQILQEIVAKSFEASPAVPSGEVGTRGIWNLRTAFGPSGTSGVEHDALPNPPGEAGSAPATPES